MIEPRCDTCTDERRKGYCAPLRCYCGHPSCYAFASFVEPKAPDVNRVPKAPTDTWADREEDSSWIDKM